MKLRNCDILDIVRSVQYMPLNKLQFLRIHNFVQNIESTFPSIKHCIVLFNEQLVWYVASLTHFWCLATNLQWNIIFFFSGVASIQVICTQFTSTWQIRCFRGAPKTNCVVAHWHVRSVVATLIALIHTMAHIWRDPSIFPIIAGQHRWFTSTMPIDVNCTAWLFTVHWVRQCVSLSKVNISPIHFDFIAFLWLSINSWLRLQTRHPWQKNSTMNCIHSSVHNWRASHQSLVNNSQKIAETIANPCFAHHPHRSIRLAAMNQLPNIYFSMSWIVNTMAPCTSIISCWRRRTTCRKTLWIYWPICMFKIPTQRIRVK